MGTRREERQQSAERESNRFATPKEAAGHYGVTVETIRNWIKVGGIQSEQPHGPGGRRFIPREQLR